MPKIFTTKGPLSKLGGSTGTRERPVLDKGFCSCVESLLGSNMPSTLNPTAGAQSMNTRQSAIVDILQKDERVSVRRLAEQLNVSQMTIRQGMAMLEEKGFLIRTHGGGLPADKLRYLRRAFPNYSVTPQKIAIGKLAPTQVQPKQTVMVDSGTPTLEVARNLPKDMDITVATTSYGLRRNCTGHRFNWCYSAALSGRTSRARMGF